MNLIPQQIIDIIIQIVTKYGLTGFFFAMIIQAIIAPIPSEMLLIIGGGLFGTIKGGFIGSIGETVGAIFSFYISKKGGRPIAKKLLGQNIMEFTDKWFNNYGAKAVLIGRLVPVVPFDAVSYGAGLTKMKFKPFIIATTIGSLPRSFFYAFIGSYIADAIKRDGIIASFNEITIIIISIIIVLYTTHKVIDKKLKNRRK